MRGLTLPPLPPPLRVNLETTLRCNLACPMCGTARGPRPIDGMAEALLERIEREILPRVRDVGLSVAGEPLLTPGLDHLVERLSSAGARIEITTNGTLSVPEAVLARAALVRFSVDAASPAIYSALRPGACLETVLDHVRDAVQRRRPPTRLALCVVLQRQNIDELPALVDLAWRLGVDRLEAAHLTVLWPDQDGESLRHDPSHADLRTSEARRMADALGFPLFLPPRMDGTPQPPTLRTRLRSLRPASAHQVFRSALHQTDLAAWNLRVGGRVPCPSLQGMIWVSLGGDVSPCCMPGRLVAGNLLRTPFSAIWNGPVLTEMRHAFLEGHPLPCCAHCSVNPRDYRPSDPQTVRPTKR